ncbi:MAG: phage holin family protein [Angelakisella sp.]|nr:phage holin family protein [Angelakisella sp.]
MSNATSLRPDAMAAVGVAGSILSALLGGWDMALQTLIIFMAVDYSTGLVVAGVFHRSGKSTTGSLESLAGWKGLCRKGGTLLLVLVAAQLDRVMGSEFCRDAVVIGFLANEAISIIENVGLMGVPFPPILRKAIEVLKNQTGEEDEKDNLPIS